LTTAPTCAIDDCAKPTKSSRAIMCSMHMSRLARTGNTDPRPPATPEQDAARFWARVERGTTTECWPWLGVILATGYGQFRAQNTRFMAHRYAYELVYGPIPDGLELDHVWARGCERIDCVNPAHLEPVASAENLRRSNAASAVNRRKQRCSLGHRYRRAKDGKRFCPTCKADWERNHRGAGAA
jgi:hypothetical protein